MDDSQLSLIQPGMHVDAADGAELGTVAHVHWQDGTPIGEGTIEIRTGLFGLGKHLFVPLPLVDEVVLHEHSQVLTDNEQGDITLSASRDELEQYLRQVEH
jgi:hypothetical protein